MFIRPSVLGLIICAALISSSAFAADVYSYGDVPQIKNFSQRVSWKYADAWKQDNGIRCLVSLNQFWNFYPTKEKKAPSVWEYRVVPGKFRGCNVDTVMRDHDGRHIAKINEIVQNWITPWEYGWYHRKIDIPATQKGKKIYLDFERIQYSNGFSISFNGQRLEFPPAFSGGKVEVTDLVRFDKDNEITVFIDASGDPYKLDAGLYGNIYLDFVPVRNVGTPEIQTRLDKKQITVDFKNPSALEGELDIVIFEWKTGKEVYRKTVPMGKNIVLDYVTPQLWSPANPFLYNIKLELRKGREALDRVVCRFGFREFKIVKDKYYLNNQPINMYGFSNPIGGGGWATGFSNSELGIKKYYQNLRAHNLCWSYIHMAAPEIFFRLADEEGIMLLVSETIEYNNMWNRSDAYVYDYFEKRLAAESRKSAYYNHPSLVGLLIDVWYNLHKGSETPEYIGLKYDSTCTKRLIRMAA